MLSLFYFQCDAKALSSMVVEQLSLSDFQEIALTSLPDNLNSCQKKVLSGKYCLQVFCSDILYLVYSLWVRTRYIIF